MSADGATAAEVTLEDWQRVIGANLTGVWLSCKHALPSTIESGNGSIINQPAGPNIHPRWFRVVGLVFLAAAGRLGRVEAAV